MAGETVATHRPFAHFRPLLEAARRAMAAAAASFAGATIEDNIFSISAHFRRVAPEQHAALQEAMRSAVRHAVRDEASAAAPPATATTPAYPAATAVVAAASVAPLDLELREGKLVLEARPAVAWHKGAAALYMLAHGGLAAAARPIVVAIGDDLTDEDTFATLRAAEAEGGACAEAVTIIVADGAALPEGQAAESDGEQLARMPRPTAARYFLRNVDEVTAMLELVAALAAEGAATEGVAAAAAGGR